ncbi:MAG: DUF3592 domain-containing protein [Planctomycetaceae bacterium]|nr:DUF3592 domain-containing protein [Phycisphaerales bacterium]MCE2654372.1 DUF3592 domain-containing protein [Planctomycetaceae bacterium]
MQESAEQGGGSRDEAAFASDRFVERRSHQRLLVAVALAILGVLSMAWMAGWAWKLWGDVSAQYGATRWPTTEGRITYSLAAPVALASGRTEYRVVLTYDYQVGRLSFIGSRVRLWRGSVTDEAWQRAVAGRYPVGTKVPVYYDPDNPRTALLEPGAALEDVGPGAVLLGLAMVPVLLCGLLVRHWRWLEVPTVGRWRLRRDPVATLEPPRWSPVITGLALSTAMLLTLPTMSLRLGAGVWGPVIGVTMAVVSGAGLWYALRRRAVRSWGHLVVNSGLGVLMAPGRNGERYVFEFGAVAGIGARHLWRRHRGFKVHRYEVWVEPAHQINQPVRVARFARKRDAEAVRSWILAEMGRQEPQWDEVVTHWRERWGGSEQVTPTPDERRLAELARGLRELSVEPKA